jgi:deoxyadenosine/deoxycytidine kinase
VAERLTLLHQSLVIINGTVGVGKTWISKCLASEIPGAVWIEGDSLGFALPERFEDSYQNDYGLKAGINLISAHRKKGASVIVFDRSFSNPKELDWFVSQVGLKSHVFYLSASEDELSNRICKRAGSRAEFEVFDSKRLQQSQDKMKNRGVEIDTNGKSAEEITTKIKNLILMN